MSSRISQLPIEIFSPGLGGNLRTSQFVVEVFAPASARLRIAQQAVEVFYGANANILVSLDAMEVFYLADSDIQISQMSFELWGKAWYRIEWGSQTGTGMRTTGNWEISSGINPLKNWILNPIAKKIYLMRLELKRRGAHGEILREFVYLSNFTYNTHPNEDPPNTEYIAILENVNIPPFSQQLTETLYGISVPSFGQLLIPNVQGTFNSFLPPDYVWDGGEVQVKLTGDRQELPLMFSPIILIGRMQMKEWGSNSIILDTYSPHRDIDKKTMAADTFDGVNGDKITIPIPYGICYNVTPKVKDSFNLIYKVANRPILGITAVYDKGVLLSPAQWTQNISQGEFTLLVNPAGDITCDLEGVIINGTYSPYRSDFILDALTVYGGKTIADFDVESLLNFAAVVTQESGIYVDGSISVLDFITQLLFPVQGYMAFDRFGFIQLGILDIISTPIPLESVDIVINSSNILPVGSPSDKDSSLAEDMFSVEIWPTVISQVVMNYDHNNTVQDGNSLGDAFPVDSGTQDGINRREWLGKEWRKFYFPPIATNTDLYVNAELMDEVPSYFVGVEGPEVFGEKWYDLLGKNRRLFSARTKILPSRKTIGAVVDFTHGEHVHLQGKVVEYKDDYSKSTVSLKFIV